MIYYKHYSKYKKSYSLLLPQLKDLMAFISLYIKKGKCDFAFKLGQARCHPNDNFSRKLGRKISEEKMKIEAVNIDKILFKEKTISLFCSNKEYSIKLTLTRNKDCIYRIEHILTNDMSFYKDMTLYGWDY